MINFVTKYRQFKKMPPGTIKLWSMFDVGSQIPRIEAKQLASLDPINCDFFSGQWRYVVNDPKLARYLYSQKNLKNRRQMLSDKEVDLAFANEDKLWSFRRGLVIRHLAKFLKSDYLDQIITTIIKNDLTPSLNEKADSGQLWQPERLFNQLLFNMGICFVFGLSKRNLRSGCLVSEKYTALLSSWMDTRLPALNVSYLPCAKYFKRIYDYFAGKPIKTHEKITNEIYELFNTHFVTPAKNDLKKNDSYFSSFFHDSSTILNSKQITADIFTLFIGFHAVSYTVSMGVLLAAKYPKVQHQLYSSLKQDMSINNQHLQAFISEVLRIDSVVTSVERVTKQNMLIELNEANISSAIYPKHVGNQYYIPKNSIVVVNSTLIHTGSIYWDTANEMDLSNWLVNNTDGGCHPMQKKEILPFGVGVRACVGVRLARKMLSELFMHIFSKFEITASCKNPAENFSIQTSNSLVRSLETQAILISHR